MTEPWFGHPDVMVVASVLDSPGEGDGSEGGTYLCSSASCSMSPILWAIC